MRVGIAVVALLSALSTFANDWTLEWSGKFERKISAYDLFENTVEQIPREGLVAYTLITPLFTDYADKHRFVYLPPGTAATYHDYDAFTFPVGTALVKTFSYHDRDSDTRTLIETRLMFNTAEKGWVGASYVWNEEQTDADLKVAGKRIPLRWTDVNGDVHATDDLVPNMNQCNHCHAGTGTTLPIGPKARNINREFNGMNQIDHWTAIGILEGAPKSAEVPRVVPWDDESYPVDLRAKAYLDINCAHCHNTNGLAGSTRLDLTYAQEDMQQRGVYYRPTAAGNASRGRYYAIVPGNPEASFLLYRLRSTESNIRMPETGRTLVHKQGAQLIEEWIRSLGD